MFFGWFGFLQGFYLFVWVFFFLKISLSFHYLLGSKNKVCEWGKTILETQNWFYA